MRLVLAVVNVSEHWVGFLCWAFNTTDNHRWCQWPRPVVYKQLIHSVTYIWRLDSVHNLYACMRKNWNKNCMQSVHILITENILGFFFLFGSILICSWKNWPKPTNFATNEWALTHSLKRNNLNLHLVLAFPPSPQLWKPQFPLLWNEEVIRSEDL